MKTWCYAIGRFKRSAHFYVCVHHIYLFHILYLLIIIITNAGKWLSGWCAGCVSLGPGFDSQVHPNNCFLFFLTRSYAGYPKRPTMHPKYPGAKWLQACIQRPRVSDYHAPSQHVPQAISKVKAGLHINGPDFQSTPPKGPAPPWFLYYFLFLFPFNLFINYYYYQYLINKLIIFTINSET